MNEELSNIISGAIGAGGAVIGVFIANWFQSRSFERQRKIQLEDAEKNNKERLHEQKMMAYNQILRMHGQSHVVVNNGASSSMLIKEYHKVRPSFYEGFHVIDPEVRDNILKIDGYIEAMNHFEEEDEEQLEYCAVLYNQAIINIEKLYMK